MKGRRNVLNYTLYYARAEEARNLNFSRLRGVLPSTRTLFRKRADSTFFVILSIFNFKHGFRLCSAGEPGYLDFDNLPETNFSCQGKVIGGYYADVEAGCQMFHVCTIGQKDEIMDIKFLCLNGTVFDQETRVCERVDEVDCSKSERFYNLNLELYGNNAVTLSLHEEEDDDGSTDSREDHQQQQQLMTSARPSTTSTTTTTTPRPNQSSTTSSYQQHQTGYPQHFQPRPAFPSVQSQSNTHYDDKNGGYHHQYIFHNDERSNNNQATSFQLFSNQGVSSTTPTPPVHPQVRYSSTANPQVIHNEPSTVTPLQFHVQSTSSTIQTLLNNNANINPLFHNHGIASTTEQFNVHNNNPREIAEYQDGSDEHDDREERRPLEPLQSTNKGKVSKLTLSPVPQQDNHGSVVQMKNSQNSQQQQRLTINYLPTPNPVQTTIRAFYPTQSPTPQKYLKPQNNQQGAQHIHVPPPSIIPQLKSHQITINLPPPDIQRIVQNPSPLLPSQSRVIVTAKASVSDESGRPLNASQLITIPLPTIPSNYDDYKEGDESFDPFYRDVPKIRNDRRILISRKVETNERSLRKRRSTNYQENGESNPTDEVIFNAEIKDIKDLKANLPIIKAILFGLPLPNDQDTEKEDEDIHLPTQSTYIENKPLTEKDPQHYREERIAENTRSPLDSRVLASSTERNRFIRVETPRPLLNKSRRRSRLKTPRVMDAEEIEDRIKLPNPLYQTTFTPIGVEPDIIDAEPKDTVQLFLRTVEGNNSLLSSNNDSFKQELLPINDSIAIDENTDKGPGPTNIRNYPNFDKANRAQDHDHKAEELQEYIPQRKDRFNRPRPSRYYDEYDVSESIEVSSRQRSNRLRPRPNDRRVTNYRNAYVDEDIDDEYDERNNFRNRDMMPRRGMQGRRVMYRNRNRHFDYDDDEIEVDEKPGLKTKSSNLSGRPRNRPYYERYPEERRRNPDANRRKNRKRRPFPTIIQNSSQNRTEAFDGQALKEENQSLAQVVDSIVRKESDKNRLNKPVKNIEVIEKHKDLIKHDYDDLKKEVPEEYIEPEERGFTDDYVEYEDLKYHTSRSRGNNRRNKNRFEDEYQLSPRRKSNRRDKSHRFRDETQLNNEKEEQTVYYDMESTTEYNDPDLVTTTLPVEYTIPDEATSSHDYEDHTSLKTTLKINPTENTQQTENIKTTSGDTTESIVKYTDELPQTGIKSDEEVNDKQRDEIISDEKDYIDDNYEPENYSSPEIQEISTLKPEEKDDQTTAVVEEQEKIQNLNKNINASNVDLLQNKEYDESYYDDGIDSTTVLIPPETYDDSEITTESISSTSTQTITSSSAPTERFPEKVTFTATSSPISSSGTTPSSTIITTARPTTTTVTFPSTTATTLSTTTTSSSTAIITPSATLTTASSSLNSSTTITPSTISDTHLSKTPSGVIITSSTTLRSTTTPRAKNKLFKPLTFRKTYHFTSPSTTPNIVNIKRGPSTSKPTKPPLSFNELSAKPLIRRLPLLSRTTTTTSEAPIFEEEITEPISKPTIQSPYRKILGNKPSIYNSHSAPNYPEIITNKPISNLVPTNKIINIQRKNTEVTSSTISPVSESILKETSLKNSNQSDKYNLENEVPKINSDSNHSNNVPQTSEDSLVEITKPESKSTTFDYDSETTTSINQKLEVVEDNQSTTLRSFRPDRRKLELTSVKSQNQKPNQGPKRGPGFNCLEKEMYRFYGDVRDCRLFHYCSPGFTARQVLDFRFVCEEGTIFDEESQSCKHNVPNPKCVKRTW